MAFKWIKGNLPEHPITRWAIALNLWILASIYFEWVLRPLGEINSLLLPIWVIFGYFNMFVLFAQFHFSLFIFSICMGFMVQAMISAPRRSLTMGYLILFLLAYAAWPLTVGKYEPAIEPAAGVNMQLVTDMGYFGSAIKRKLARYEGNACDYELLGWDERNILYYESNCGVFGNKLWGYDPINGQSLSVSHIPAETELKSAGSRSIYGKNYAHPTGFENDGLNLYVDAYAYSPDGEWAAMESKHIYSVHDVVVFSKK